MLRGNSQKLCSRLLMLVCVMGLPGISYGQCYGSSPSEAIQVSADQVIATYSANGCPPTGYRAVDQHGRRVYTAGLQLIFWGIDW
jgi:hypothetical protein